MSSVNVEHRVYLGLGGNLGDPAEAMGSALRLLDRKPGISVNRVSSLYRTPPWGKTDQPDFLNAVAEIMTSLDPTSLLSLCLDIEQGLKRVRNERWGPRSIDIDILWFQGLTIARDGLHIPHPRMLERAFVMIPLAELAPDLELEGTAASTRASMLDSSGIDIASQGDGWWRGA